MDPIFFIRHKPTPEITDLNTILSLMKDNRIAIFFDNLEWESAKKFISSDASPILSHSDKQTKITKTYATALKYIDRLSKDGGYVFAEYGVAHTNDSEAKGCIFAKIEPKTKVESITINGQQINITLRFKVMEIIDYAVYPVLLAIRPIRSTISQASQTYKLVANLLINKLPIDPKIDFLHPKMLEQLCVEYLIKVGTEDNDDNHKLDYCFLRPGKTMAHIDIAGKLINKRKIYAQVKKTPINREDKSAFIDFIKGDPDCLGVIFADFSQSAIKKDHEFQSIQRICITTVFAHFYTKNRIMIEDMIGLNNLPLNKGYNH